jgi:hypothetical protein
MKQRNSPSPSFFEKIRPTNLEKEKEKFLFDNSYNPQFEYSQEIPEETFLRFGPVQAEFLPLAQRILDDVLVHFGSETAFREQTRGKLLSRAETTESIDKFLRLNRLESMVRIIYSSDFTARTSLKKVDKHFVLQIRLPVEYRELSLESMLYHEIGTHLFRWLNEIEQPWYQHHEAYGLSKSFALTEEGLASLNGLLTLDQPFLWSEALSYFTVVEGSRSSFATLYKKLKKYVDDPERRWRYCLKAKRGITDTSLPLVLSKGQIYFIGLLDVLSWLQQNDFLIDQLFLGKISLDDLKAAQSLATHQPILPSFLHSRTNYQQKLQNIIRLNHLEKYL